MARDQRASVERAREFATGLGYKITEFNYLDVDEEPEVILRFAGYGEEIEVYFQPHPDTGYLRFRRGELVHDYSVDRIPSWKRTTEMLVSIREAAIELGWRVDREPDEEE